MFRASRVTSGRAALVLASLLLAAPALTLATPARAEDTDTTAVGELKRQAVQMKPLFKTPLVERFLAATADLPHIQDRVVFRDSAATRYWSEAQAMQLPDSVRSKLVRRQYDEGFYYFTRYGSPLAYARVLELLYFSGFKDVSGRKLLDFGYGTIGHLRLLASLGADAVGVEVDPLHPVFYGQPGDQGTIRGRHGKDGKLRLVNGRYPSTPQVIAEVGDQYDLFISKNTLKYGYIHPERPTEKRFLVDLGVNDTVVRPEPLPDPQAGRDRHDLQPESRARTRRTSRTSRGPTAAARSPGRCWNRPGSRSWSSTATMVRPRGRWGTPWGGTRGPRPWISRRTCSRITR